ncbi:BREX-2 system phosphatase PglZ [Micromonospora sp. LHW51205]|uniref:BREX-2 system phosphatase PglZ n=1 Tax=Micromonospora TaxID=1873 RepID=UPI000DEA1319|nr:BREX-2 system phosphatase PglZ [Micromonospora sp. LHW51205]RBQ12548.1 BREX-2 system phosphatase PglZ [Micromonospora sp. LHW51205]
MSVPRAAVRPAAVRRKVEAWLAERDDADAIVLLARPYWTDEPVLTVGGRTVRVVPCPTPLAARAALADRSAQEKLVLLTDLTDSELGDGLLAHVSLQTGRSVDPWDLVSQAFGGQVRPDSTLVRIGRWVADALTELAPAEGWPPPTGTILTRDHALRHLAGTVLGLEPDGLDAAGLLHWSTDAAAQMRLSELPAEWIDGLGTFMVDVAGPVAVPVLAAVRAGQGVDAIPLGLLTGVLWPRDSAQASDVELAVARTRLEPRFAGTRLTETQAWAFTDAAEAWIYRALDDEAVRHDAHRLLRRAEEVAGEIGVAGRLAASALLPAGFTQRMRAFGAAVRLALPVAGGAAPAADLIERAQDRLAEVEAHRSADRARVETARMAVRLLRWLATPDQASPATMLDAVHRQIREDGWVDRARLDVFDGDVDQQVAEAYRILHQAVHARRSRHDREFAELLQDTTGAERDPGALLRVEDLLDRVVQPILDHGRRVLLLLLDGMGAAAGIEIAESLGRSGAWTELTPHGGQRTGVLAALPTVTAVNRCSLFSGMIRVGDRNDEVKGFAARFPDGVLLHKADLRTSAGVAVDREVAAAIENPAVPLVAAVINTIDDALDRSDPGTVEWSADTVRGLRDLIAVAQDRVVVLVSDHGHVVDRGSEALLCRSESSENRWRPATGEPADGELRFRGSRVALGGGDLILPWREELRYGPRKAGYHGGASPAEAVIPLLLFASGDDEAVPGWSGAPVASPDWWREPVRQTAPEEQPALPVPRTAAARPTRRPRAAVQDESLFDVPPQAPVAAVLPPPAGPPAPIDPSSALVEALLASPVYADRRGSRAPVPDERVAAMVTALLAGNGRATLETLATRAEVPVHRISATFTALRRLLQVEGYPVLSLDPDGRTAKLDIPLMIEQFVLGPS